MGTGVPLKDLYIGQVDARNEIGETDVEKQRFLDSYYIPENLDVNDYLVGKLFYITGLKGVGKTALMRYLGATAEKDGSCVSFLLFKSDITEQQRGEFQKERNLEVVDSATNEFRDDYKALWKLFLHRVVAKNLSENDGISLPTKALERYIACVSAARSGDTKSGLWKLFPRIKKGAIEVGLDEIVKANIKLDFEWDDPEKRTVQLDTLVLQADSLLSELSPGSRRMYVFIDELELTINHPAKYKRDAMLIRDLIQISSDFNRLFVRHKLPIKIVVGIRTEVLSSEYVRGEEINKLVSDFGEKVKWDPRGSDIEEHPLLQLIVKKIRASELGKGVDKKVSDIVLWRDYFPPSIQGMPSDQYILNNTWFRPRDIVRMLGLIKKQYKMKTSFSEAMFTDSKKDYSYESWDEIVEDLSAKYSQAHLEAIAETLLGYKQYFGVEEYERHCKHLAELSNKIRGFIEKHAIVDVLEDLYRIGAVGNCEPSIRFSFRGDVGLIKTGRILIHHALLRRFSIKALAL